MLYFSTLKRKCQERFLTFAQCEVVPTWGRLCKKAALKELPLKEGANQYERKLSVYDVKYLIELIVAEFNTVVMVE